MFESKAAKLLKTIARVQLASKYNISTFTLKTADTLEGSLKEPGRPFTQLSKAGFIAPVPTYDCGKTFRHNTFYRVTKTGHQAIDGHKYRYVEPRSINNLEHTSGLLDVHLGFVYNYPNFKIAIDCNKVLDGYKPDAHIRLTSNEIKPRTFDFLIEFERTRSNKAIIDEKFKKNEKLKPSLNTI
jgi:hypothetical protein